MSNKLKIVNVINLVHRTDRLELFKKQADEIGFNYKVWYGMEVTNKPFTGISRSHKQVVEFAKNTCLEYCIIAEDDVSILSKKAWQYYLDNMPEDYDLYLSTISGGVVDEKTGTVSDWSGMILYTVHQRFYDAFLKADEEQNIDRWLSCKGLDEIERVLGRLPVYKICYPIAAICVDGFSDNSNKEVSHDQYFYAYKKFQ